MATYVHKNGPEGGSNFALKNYELGISDAAYIYTFLNGAKTPLKVKNADNADNIGGIPYTSFLRTDMDDTTVGMITIAKNGRGILLGNQLDGDNLISGNAQDGSSIGWDIGRTQATSNDLYVRNLITDANINLDTSGAGLVQINNNPIWHSGNFDPDSKEDHLGPGPNQNLEYLLSTHFDTGLGEWVREWVQESVAVPILNPNEPLLGEHFDGHQSSLISLDSGNRTVYYGDGTSGNNVTHIGSGTWSFDSATINGVVLTNTQQPHTFLSGDGSYSAIDSSYITGDPLDNTHTLGQAFDSKANASELSDHIDKTGADNPHQLDAGDVNAPKGDWSYSNGVLTITINT